MFRQTFSSPRLLKAGLLATTLSLGLLNLGAVANEQPGKPLAATLTAPTAADKVALKLPSTEAVMFRGVYSLDQVGLPMANMLYPGGNLVGFLASVVTHGLIVEGEKLRQRNKAEQEADRVLEALMPAIRAINMTSLFDGAVGESTLKDRAHLLRPDQENPSRSMIEPAPVIWISQDRLSLIADVAMSVQVDAQQAMWQGRVRVVSPRLEVADAVEHWNADEGQQLKQVCAQLVGKAIDVGFAYAQADSNKIAALPFQSVAYTVGGKKKVERAQVLHQDCNYRLLKTLRGDLFAVPNSRLHLDDEDENPACPTASSTAPS
ncbi:hypothetical protein [Paucibacter sp. Y2R2-4]|uniref:hypothetical protein n=1 Tax=Paucibacter sp. Y2R2-4 TaxID=2893553 RepID=UPI0021E4EBEC|nr:hypothetical protein [Paucibacter sp. Y2R2-4]MCV2350554.1 hypothetical protein [Paucibacter sp. Y2R2-4]